MFPYDPEFVKEMSTKGFDPHLDLAKFAGVVTQDQINVFVRVKDDLDKGSKVEDKDLAQYSVVGVLRKQYKAANYACVYGVGAVKLARTTGLAQKAAKALIDTFKKRNWALEEIKKNTEVIKLDGDMWLFNPVSRFWYSLRNEKDIFSTLNQGTGVFCFDSWIREGKALRRKYKIKTFKYIGQFHDEVVVEIDDTPEKEAQCREVLKEAIGLVNQKLKLNVQLDVGIDFGYNYSEIH